MRQPRRISSSDIYHVVARGTGRQLIFEDDRDRARFLELLSNHADASHVRILAWCLMSNHVHLLLHASLDDISACMRRILGAYAEYFNAKAGRVGHLFQDRFASEPIESDEQLLTVVPYIHNNPVKAGVACVDEYQWSSYREYLGGKGLCDTALLLGMCQGVEGFVELHANLSPVRYIDVDQEGRRRRSIPDSEALQAASEVLGGIELESVKGLTPAQRNKAIVTLKRAGLTVRQIERLTGIGRNVVQRAKHVEE